MKVFCGDFFPYCYIGKHSISTCEKTMKHSVTKKTFLICSLMLLCISYFQQTIIIQADTDDDVFPLIYAVKTTAREIDPLAICESAGRILVTNVLEPLFAYDYSDPALPIIPRLTKNMGTWNANLTEWTIPLREEMTFHHGQKFNATTVWWNFYRINYLTLSGDNVHAALWMNDEGQLILNRTEIIDEYTVKLVLNKPWSDLEDLLAFWGTSMLVYDPQFTYQILELNDINYYFGTGPYILDSITVGENVVLNKNENYYRGPPVLDQIIMEIYQGPFNQKFHEIPDFADDQGLFNQEIHIIPDLCYTNLELAEADPDVQYKKTKGPACLYFNMDITNIPRSARKAIQYALNYSFIIEEMYLGTTFEHHSPIPDGIWGYNKDLAGLPYFNITRARNFLFKDPSFTNILKNAELNTSSADADWISVAEGDTPIATYNFTHTDHNDFYNFLQDSLSFLGFKIENNWIEQKSSYRDFLTNPENPIGIIVRTREAEYFSASNQIEPVYRTNGTENYSHLANNTLDEMCAALHSMVKSPEKQAKIDELIRAIIVDNAAGMYVHQFAKYIAYSPLFLDPDTLDDLFNPHLDKYFYNIKWPQWHPSLPEEEKTPPFMGWVINQSYKLLGMMMLCGVIIGVIIYSQLRVNSK
jgi:ABC-type transport system substrate-binding protein